MALARALVVEPAVLLLDEPLGALDLKLRRQMQDELKAIQKRVGTAFVHVTHDQEEAMALADHCVVMNDGRIEDEGPPERVYARPATRFTATFMGESTLMSGTVIGDAHGHVAVDDQARPLCRCPAAARRQQRSPWRSGRRHLVVGEAAGTGLRSATATVSRRRLPGQLQARAGRFRDRPGDPLHRQGSRDCHGCSPATSVAVSCDAGDIILLTR